MQTQNTDMMQVNEHGNANMDDVTDKQITQRQAVAEGYISMTAEAFNMLKNNSHAKGDVLSIARIAGIQGAKKCSELIPLCHPLMLSKVQLDFHTLDDENKVRIQALCKLAGQTGVEMEALTAVSVAALTLFDMCKAVDPHMEISNIKVLSKQGGKSGDWSC